MSARLSPRSMPQGNDVSICVFQLCRRTRVRRHLLLGSLRNHDDNGNKNVTNLHIWQWKTIDLHALHVHFSFLDIPQTFSLNDLFCSCEDDVSTWWQMFNFVFLSLKRWFQFNSWIVRTHFATVLTLNNSEMTAETRSYIFRWRSRCRRGRVCVNSLFWARSPPVFKRAINAFKKNLSRDVKDCKKITHFSISMDILRVFWEFGWQYCKDQSTNKTR